MKIPTTAYFWTLLLSCPADLERGFSAHVQVSEDSNYCEFVDVAFVSSCRPGAWRCPDSLLATEKPMVVLVGEIELDEVR